MYIHIAFELQFNINNKQINTDAQLTGNFMNLSIIVSLIGVKLLRGRSHFSSLFSLSFFAPSVTS